MARGKHSLDEGFDLESIPWKKIGIFFIIVAIVILVFWGGKTVVANGYLLGRNNKTEEEKVEEVVEIEEKMPTNLYGYNVLGKLTIESKNFSNYIVEVDEKENEVLENSDNNVIDTSKETITNTTSVSSNESENKNSANIDDLSKALEKCLVKLYGERLNSVGNFCIIGHNKDKLFSVLEDVNLNDEFEIENQSGFVSKYIITEIKKVEPSDLTCLLPNDKYKEVTLITCTSGSNERLVVKALEEDDYKLSKIENETEDNESLEENNIVE